MKNYFSRKITVILVSIISLAVAVIYINLFFRLHNRIDYEFDWLRKNLTEVEPEELLKNIEYNSTTYQLRYLTTIFGSIIVCASLLIFIISNTIIYGLFSNKFNGSNLYKYILYLITIILVVMFIYLTLQPQELVVQVKKELAGTEFWVNVYSDKIPYYDAFSGFALSFILLVLTFISKSSFGYLKKDIILAKKFKEINN
ncbi:hypothetical protein [Mycoplasma anserisalpingitidis]|uniref:hypothetical protein n=1 Tax=Mycoplasma anserisalpingitidis TaxID=519450 RepID=UPI001CF6C953|nr:hypothetical protein [Mycoplasma anserisalpingitidis]UCU26719.1 hypothetical protein K7D06_00085 [Mycoplasma anserisalpingitidis]UCU27559.1 hypothetical protein K9O38_00755 [Mycoplasma anserisalpingitidis]